MAGRREPARVRQRRAEDRPDEIIAAALALFAEKGFAATRMDDIAKAAGLSKAGVYLYFPSKAEVFKAAVRTTIVPIVAHVESLSRSFTGSSEDLLRRLVGEIVRATAGPAGVIPKIVMSEAGNFPDIARFYAGEVVSRGFGLISTVIARGVARGEFVAMPGGMAPFAVISPILMLALWNNGIGRALGQPLDPSAYVDAVYSVLARGLLVREGGA